MKFKPLFPALTCIFIFFSKPAYAQNDSNISENYILSNQNNKRMIKAVEISNPPGIDGDLLDPAWENVPFQGGFVQREPVEGALSTEKTEVGIAFDSDNLYIGIKCYDSEPDKIIAREMRRDAFVDNDDFFELIIDTYRDQRSGFYFIINPNGVKRDAMLANEGRQYNPAWDGIWQCRTSVTDEGWFAEIAIPWKTLRFASADEAVWGINFARMIRRKNEHVFWQLVPRDLGRSGLFRLSEAGGLTGLKNLRTGGNLEVQPYFLGGIENDMFTDHKTEYLTNVGLDAKISITPNLTLDLTVNTDFAQVEADDQQVNLTRFSLYFPEKREFFLEGAEVFSFGASGGMMRHFGPPVMDLFYSRRIGLHNGYETPILGGAKLVGKIGKYQIGFLNMLTDEVRIETETVLLSAPRTNNNVIRLRRDISDRGTVGMMILNKDKINNGVYNRSIGFDAYLPLNQHFTVSGYIAGTINETETLSASILSTKKNLAANLAFNYNSDLWQAGLTYTDIGADFNPALGFVRRVDYRHTTGSVSYSPRPAQPSAIRQYSYSASGGYRADHSNRMLEAELGASFSIQFQNSARFNLGLTHDKEYVDYDWNVRTDHLIEKGVYQGYSGSAGFQTDPSRDISGSFNIGYGHYYGGTNLSIGVSSGITNFAKTRLEINYNYNIVDLPTGRFHTNTYRLRGFYYFSTELHIKAFIQLNDDKLRFAGRENVMSNIMLRWIYKPGSDLYLVYNDGRLIGPGDNLITNRTFMLKAAFFWRK